MNFDFGSKIKSTIQNLLNMLSGSSTQNKAQPLAVTPTPTKTPNPTWTPEQDKFRREALQRGGMTQEEYYQQGFDKTNPGIGQYLPTGTPTPTPTIPQIPSAIPSPTPPPVYQNSTLADEFVNFLESNIFPITRTFGIPDALVASQWAVEGGRSLGNEANNMFGILSPSGSGELVQYPTQERGVEDYSLTVNNIAKAKGLDLSQNQDVNAYDILMALQAGDRPRYEAHNPNQWDYTQTVMNTPEWRYYFGNTR